MRVANLYIMHKASILNHDEKGKEVKTMQNSWSKKQQWKISHLFFSSLPDEVFMVSRRLAYFHLDKSYFFVPPSRGSKALIRSLVLEEDERLLREAEGVGPRLWLWFGGDVLLYKLLLFWAPITDVSLACIGRIRSLTPES